MAKGYWIAGVDVYDEDGYKSYVVANGPVFRKFGGRFLVRGARATLKEGQCRARNVVIEFASYQAALDCYNSPEYQQALALRKPVSAANLIIIEGYDDPQS